MKIAIIGSGISGMTCSHLLADGNDVHLFEAGARLGGHTHTHDVKTQSGNYRIDTGFIVFNDRNYPHFVKLMDSLKVESKESFMSFSVKVQKNGLEYNGTSINSLFCQRKNFFNPSFYRMIKDIMRFNKEATEFYLKHKDVDPTSGQSLEEYLATNKYSDEFIEHYIMPMGAAIWSASREEMKKFPLHFFVRFFHHHGMLTVDDRPTWRVLLGGSSSYIPKLTAKIEKNIHLNSPVVSVIRKDGGVILETIIGGEQRSLNFDQVIFACHADQAMKILQDPNQDERDIMGNFSYRPNDVILHTDESVMPKSKLGYASWNYYLPEIQKERVAVTYNMNILQGISAPETFLVSLNMDELIDQKKVIKKIPYHHPVYNAGAVKSQAAWDKISGKNQVHFCGAYWGNGFHEDGVKSALRVTATFGRNLP
jgi:predicted NAD/FAD-binding protein